ncbi:MAG TPA: ATP-binding protein [Candidatus Thermoplasmatota archaeon]|nr:ATP-binding protein [Candidatus Thermoplasmatota archaeon]
MDRAQPGDSQSPARPERPDRGHRPDRATRPARGEPPVAAAKGVNVANAATAVPPAPSVPLTGAQDAVISPPPLGTEEPVTIAVPKAPGQDGAMEVVVAAEVLRRVNRARQAVSLVSQVVIRAYEEEALHAEVCRHLISYGGYLMAWIGLAEEGPAKEVRPVAHAGLEPNFLSALKITWANDLSNQSPTSRAVVEQRPYVARNILHEPRYAVLRKEAQLFGYSATCALPLQFAQYGMGVLTIHALEPDAFNAEEVSLLRELARDLSAGIINLRDRARRQVLEDRLSAVVDAADDAIVGNDIKGLVTDWNQGATRLFGYTRHEVIGRPIEEFLVPEDRLEEDARVRAALVKGERIPPFETVRRCKDGHLVHTAVTVSPIYGAEGQVVGSTSVGHDVTAARLVEVARRAAEVEEAEVARLKGLEKLRRTFLSEASHELNTPLTPLRLQVEVLKEASNLTPEQREQLALIERNVLRLCKLVTGMLDASRLETGRYQLKVEDIALSAMVDDVAASLRDTAQQAGIGLVVAPQGDCMVAADRDRVGQVLFNLVTNAIHYTRKGGRITVTMEKGEESGVVRVRDTGVGLTVEQIAQLFQPFSRPHDPAPSNPRGTGLGLFISKGIIEQLGGGIWAESEGPGKGSTFCFSLPLAHAPRERLQLFAKATQDPASRGEAKPKDAKAITPAKPNPA